MSADRDDDVRPSLVRMMEAESVAIVGASATRGSVGATTLAELLAGGYRGRVFPVNPRHRELEGLRCYPSIGDVPQAVDLAVIAVANARLEEQVAHAAESGAASAVIFGSAFEEPADGVEPLTRRLTKLASGAGMALCGANCMGFVNAARSLRVCGYVLPADLGPGPVSLISHSGSTFSALLHNNRSVRFNVAVSPGQELVTTAADYLAYCASLDDTRVVGMVIEQIRDFEGFSAAMETVHQRGVVVVVVKVGSDPRSNDLVAAHSGALAGDDAAYEAFFESTGVHRARTLDELVDTLELFSSPRRAGPGGLAAVTDSGGERALLVDLADGVTFNELTPDTTRRIAAVLDPGLPAVNPVDAWGTGVEADHVFSEALGALSEDSGTAAVIFAVDLTGESWPRYVSVAIETARMTTKPFAVLTNYPGGMNRVAARELRAKGIPVLEGTGVGLAAIHHLFDQRDFDDRPSLQRPAGASPEVLDRWITRLADQRPLSEVEALALVEAWGIPVSRSISSTSEESAIDVAMEIGWPVVLKTAARGVIHKTDVAGVVLGLNSADRLRDAYATLTHRLGPDVTVQAMARPGVELALGVVHEPGLGPIVVVGAGGILVELMHDRALGLPPLDAWRARRLVDGLRLKPLLDGARGGQPVNVNAVVSAVVRLSALAKDLAGHFDALDVNPLVADEAGCVAVDALVLPARPLP